MYLRKAEKIDPILGEILGGILRKSVKGKPKISEKDAVNKIEKLVAENLVELAKEIKINKFKYAIAVVKPEANTSIITQ